MILIFNENIYIYIVYLLKLHDISNNFLDDENNGGDSKQLPVT